MPPEPSHPAGPLRDVAAWRVRLVQGLLAFWPAPVTIDAQERWRSVLGALVGMGLTAGVSHWLLAVHPGNIWMLAPMGASAVLVFAVPASPLAQPWAVLGGNGVSALAGVACARWIDNPVLAASVAVPLAIFAMLRLRCLHPPGGAMALSAVLSHWVGWDVAWGALAVNGGLMLVTGVAYNSLTGRPYPHVQRRAVESVVRAQGRFTPGDLDAALAHYNQVLDVSRDDLENLLQHAEMAAYRRNLGALACADVMSRNPVAVQFGTPLQEAWALLLQHRVKALPVVDRVRRIVGIVTVADFMRHAGLAPADGLGQRLRDFLRPTGKLSAGKPEAVGQIMTR